MHAKGVVPQQGVLRRVLRRFWKGFWGRVLRRVLRRGSVRRVSEKGVSRRCLGRPFGEYAPLGVRPTRIATIFCRNRPRRQPNCRKENRKAVGGGEDTSGVKKIAAIFSPVQSVPNKQFNREPQKTYVQPRAGLQHRPDLQTRILVSFARVVPRKPKIGKMKLHNTKPQDQTKTLKITSKKPTGKADPNVIFPQPTLRELFRQNSFQTNPTNK